jgi:hypothetical protein
MHKTKFEKLKERKEKGKKRGTKSLKISVIKKIMDDWYSFIHS